MPAALLTLLNILGGFGGLFAGRGIQSLLAKKMAGKIPALTKMGAGIDKAKAAGGLGRMLPGQGMRSLIGQEVFIDAPAFAAGSLLTAPVTNALANDHSEGVMDMSAVAASDPLGMPVSDMERIIRDLRVLDPDIDDLLLQVTNPQQQNSLRLI